MQLLMPQEPEPVISDLTNIDIAKPVQVYRNLKNRDVC